MSVSGCSDDTPREERRYRFIYHNLSLSKVRRIVSDSECLAEKDLEGKPVAASSLEYPSLESVVYKLDGDDVDYLDASKAGISKEAFELAMDRLEKEWFFFVQGLVDRHVSSVEARSPCDICTRDVSADDDALLVCQGCRVCVHESCYGAQDSSDFWLCRRCIYGESHRECMFCMSPDGALKQTSDNRWGHVLCAMFIRSVSFGHPMSKDPIDVGSYSEEPRCMFCSRPGGAAIGCAYLTCPAKYHVACGADRCYFDVENGVSYCADHDPCRRSPYELERRGIGAMRYFGYEKLRRAPVVRKKVCMTQVRTTLFTKLLRMDAMGVPSMLSRIMSQDMGDMMSEDVLEDVATYWAAKRRGTGGGLMVLSGIRPGQPMSEWMNKRKA